MGGGSSVTRPVRSAKLATPRLECELARSPPVIPGDGDEDSCLMCASASSADPNIKLGNILGLISSLLADSELRAAVLLVKDLASSSLGNAEMTGTQSAFKNQVAQILDTHTSVMSQPLSEAIKRHIGNDKDDVGSSSSWQQSTSGGNELASSPLPTRPRKGLDTTPSVDSNAEPNLQLKDVLGLLEIPLNDSELRAASLLVDGLVASTLAEAELSFTQSALKDQVAQVLATNRSALSNLVFAFINRRIGADANIATQESGSAASSPRSPDIAPAVSPRTSWSFTLSFMSSHSSFDGLDVIGERTSFDFAVGHVAPAQAWFHHEHIDASGSEHPASTESDGSFDGESADETRTPTSASSYLDGDDDSESEQDLFQRRTV